MDSLTRRHTVRLSTRVLSLESILLPYINGDVERATRLSEDDVRCISDGLCRINKDSWARVPRLYVVLRMIDHLQVLDSFITEGVSDLWFPFSNRSLPESLRRASARNDFLKLQEYVLSKALDLEKEDGKHRHFARAEDVPLQKLEELGKGGFGFVDRVVSTITFKEYARKLLPRGKTFQKNAEVLRSYEKELISLKKATHLHIVEFIGSYTDPKFVGILMSPVADCNLKDYLTSSSLSSSQISFLRTFFGCLANALCYLHEIEIRHKDIKPENVLVRGAQVYLTDFGLALDWSELGQSTTTGLTARTPRYCAPEVAFYQPRNSQSDLWSLGCVYLEIWSVLKGQRLELLDQFLGNHGTRATCYYMNIGGTSQWCDTVEAHDADTTKNVPVDWIRGLLNLQQEDRWTAHMLANRIHEANNNPDLRYAFSCSQCLHADDSSESVCSSSESSQKMNETEDTSVFAEDLLSVSQNSVKGERVMQDLPIPLEINPSSVSQWRYDVQKDSSTFGQESRSSVRENQTKQTSVSPTDDVVDSSLAVDHAKLAYTDFVIDPDLLHKDAEEGNALQTSKHPIEPAVTDYGRPVTSEMGKLSIGAPGAGRSLMSLIATATDAVDLDVQYHELDASSSHDIGSPAVLSESSRANETSIHITQIYDPPRSQVLGKQDSNVSHVMSAVDPSPGATGLTTESSDALISPIGVDTDGSVVDALSGTALTAYTSKSDTPNLSHPTTVSLGSYVDGVSHSQTNSTSVSPIKNRTEVVPPMVSGPLSPIRRWIKRKSVNLMKAPLSPQSQESTITIHSEGLMRHDKPLDAVAESSRNDKLESVPENSDPVPRKTNQSDIFISKAQMFFDPKTIPASRSRPRCIQCRRLVSVQQAQRASIGLDAFCDDHLPAVPCICVGCGTTVADIDRLMAETQQSWHAVCWLMVSVLDVSAKLLHSIFITARQPMEYHSSHPGRICAASSTRAPHTALMQIERVWETLSKFESLYATAHRELVVAVSHAAPSPVLSMTKVVVCASIVTRAFNFVRNSFLSDYPDEEKMVSNMHGRAITDWPKSEPEDFHKMPWLFMLDWLRHGLRCAIILENHQLQSNVNVSTIDAFLSKFADGYVGHPALMQPELIDSLALLNADRCGACDRHINSSCYFRDGRFWHTGCCVHELNDARKCLQCIGSPSSLLHDSVFDVDTIWLTIAFARWYRAIPRDTENKKLATENEIRTWIKGPQVVPYEVNKIREFRGVTYPHIAGAAYKSAAQKLNHSV